MGQDNRDVEQGSEDKQGGTIDQQPGGEGVRPARESPSSETAGREPLAPGPVDKGDSWRPTDDVTGERQDGEDGKTVAGTA